MCTASICRGSTHWTTQPCLSFTRDVSTLRKVLGMRLHSTAFMVWTYSRGGHWGTGFLCSLLKMADERGMAFCRSTKKRWNTNMNSLSSSTTFFHFDIVLKNTSLGQKVLLNCMNILYRYSFMVVSHFLLSYAFFALKNSNFLVWLLISLQACAWWYYRLEALAGGCKAINPPGRRLYLWIQCQEKGTVRTELN